MNLEHGNIEIFTVHCTVFSVNCAVPRNQLIIVSFWQNHFHYDNIKYVHVYKIVIILSQLSHNFWASLHENMKEFELPVLIGSYRSSDDRIQSRRSPKFINYHIFISLRSRLLKVQVVGFPVVCLENCQDYSDFRSLKMDSIYQSVLMRLESFLYVPSNCNLQNPNVYFNTE